MVTTRQAETLQKTKEIIAFVATTTNESIEAAKKSDKYTKPFEFEIRKNSETDFSIFIVGTKTKGTERELTLWKTKPVVMAKAHQNFATNRTSPLEWWVQFKCLGGGYGDDNEKSLEYIKSGHLKKMIDEAIKTAIEDFTEQ
jgi:hypothetical protein